LFKVKSTPPRYEGLVRRQRLLQWVRTDAPGLWLAAPAASGKTSFLADYVAFSGRPVVWYQLDRYDADAVMFFEGLADAFRRAGCRRLPPFRSDYSRDLAGYGRKLLSVALPQLPVGVLLAFDNVEWLPDDSPVHTALADLVALRPHGMQCLIASRCAPEGSWLPLIVNGSVQVIDAEGLRFSEDELRQLAALRVAGADINADHIASLWALTGGWAGGCVIGLDQLSAGIPVRSVSTDQIFSFFAGEVLQRAEPALRQFLLRTSILPSFSVESATHISGMKDAGKHLQGLYQRQLFIDRRGVVAPQYQYHPLFRQFLIRVARVEWSTEDVESWISGAVALLDNRGESEAALALAEEQGMWSLVASLLSRHGAVLIADGRTQTLVRLLESMPRLDRLKYPDLDYWHGMALLLVRPAQSRFYLEQAYRRMPDSALQRRYEVWMAIVHTYLVEFGSYVELDRWLAELELLQRRGRVRGFQRRGRMQLTLYAALAFRRPDDSRLAELETILCRYLTVLPDSDERLLLAGVLGFFAAMTGDVSSFHRYRPVLERGVSDSRRTPIARLLGSLVQAMYLWYAESPGAGEAAALQGLELGAELGIRSLDFMFLLMATYGCHAAGEHDKASRYLQRIPLSISQERRTFYGNYLWLLGWEELLRGEPQAAMRYFTACTDMADDVGMPYATCQAWYGRAQAALRVGQLHEAGQAGRLSLSLAERYGFRPFRALSALTLADVERQQQRLTEANTSLREALMHMHDDKLPFLPYWSNDWLARQFAHACENGILVSTVTAWIRQRGMPCPPGADHVWPWPLNIQVMGEFRISIAGEPASLSRRLPQKPMELLALLICERRPWALTDLALVLWPEVDNNRGQAALKTTLARLRRLVGVDALILQRGQLALDPLRTRVDWWALAGLDTSDWRTALTLYHGQPFAGFRCGEWLDEYIERMQLRLRNMLLRGLQHAERDGDGDSVTRLCEALLKDDPVCEPAWQALIRKATRRGDMTAARHLLEQCRTLMRRELGVDPAPETLRLLTEGGVA
jgi:LuxR family transcriptional regulator, maltose regulon positive regulatory protein